MEKKQLNLNAPLLSVRKPTSNLTFSDVKKKLCTKRGPIRQPSLPLQKSEGELGDVTKPGTVPFRWEQIPGRTKGEYEDTDTPKRSTSTPRLPPGRLPDTVRRYSGERCNDQKIVRHYSGERCNDQKIVRRHSGERCNDQKSYWPKSQVYPFNDHAALIASLKENLNANEESDLGSVDDAYSDAVDTQSPTASFSLNCSTSGLSGLEVPNMKQPGNSDIDPQTRDFMMSRFLPAAKAAVVEIPQYIPKKQSVSSEQPKQLLLTEPPKQPVLIEEPEQPKKMVSRERKPFLEQFESDFMSHDKEYAEDVQSEVEDVQSNEPKKKSGKAWGIFPRLCVKKSLCLFNPVPAIKTRPQFPKSPPTDVGRFTRKAYSGPLDKQSWDANNKRTFHSGVLTRDLDQAGNKQGETKQFTHTSYKAGGLSPCRPFRNEEISPYRNATSQSPFRKGTRYLGLPKGADNVTAERYNSLYKKCSNLLDAAPPRISRQVGVSPNEVVEKTLYVDSVTTVNLIKDLASSQAERHVNSTCEKLKISGEAKRMEDSSLANCGNQEVKPLDAMKEGTKLDPKSPLLAPDVLHTSSCMSELRVLSDRTKVSELNNSFSEEATALVRKNASEVEKDANAVTIQSPLAPPLPKSPSESWLWRTLPSIHVRIPFSPSHHGKNLHIKKVDQKATTPGTKWETMVKSSNLCDDHSHYSEEHFPRVSRKQNKI